MYRDTEYAYRGWTIDVYRSTQDGAWCADWRNSSHPDGKGSARATRKKEVEAQAEAAIDAYIAARAAP